MALTYDLAAVKDRDTSDDAWVITKACIFHCMGTYLTDITEENAADVYARIAFMERELGETLVTQDGGRNPYYLQPGDIHAHIGVSTNVGHSWDQPQWIRHVVKRTNEYRRRWNVPGELVYADVKKYLDTAKAEYRTHFPLTPVTA